MGQYGDSVMLPSSYVARCWPASSCRRGAVICALTNSSPPAAVCHCRCADQDPIFKGNKVPNPEMGYPGGIFDPLGFSKGNLKELQTKEIKNGRIAMVAYMGFVLQVRVCCCVCCRVC